MLGRYTISPRSMEVRDGLWPGRVLARRLRAADRTAKRDQGQVSIVDLCDRRARATFARFHVTDVATTDSIGGRAEPFTELIVSNFLLP